MRAPPPTPARPSVVMRRFVQGDEAVLQLLPRPTGHAAGYPASWNEPRPDPRDRPADPRCDTAGRPANTSLSSAATRDVVIRRRLGEQWKSGAGSGVIAAVGCGRCAPPVSLEYPAPARSWRPKTRRRTPQARSREQFCHSGCDPTTKQPAPGHFLPDQILRQPRPPSIERGTGGGCGPTLAYGSLPRAGRSSVAPALNRRIPCSRPASARLEPGAFRRQVGDDESNYQRAARLSIAAARIVGQAFSFTSSSVKRWPRNFPVVLLSSICQPGARDGPSSAGRKYRAKEIAAFDLRRWRSIADP